MWQFETARMLGLSVQRCCIRAKVDSMLHYALEWFGCSQSQLFL